MTAPHKGRCVQPQGMCYCIGVAHGPSCRFWEAEKPPAKPVHMRAVAELRLAVVDRTSTESPRLQQKWISDDAARYEWRDVPTVVV